VPPSAPVSPGITARIIHAGLVLGVMLFYAVAWYVGTKTSMPVSAVPDRRVLYLGLFLVSAVLFGAAMYTAGRLTPPAAGMSQEDWWRANLSRAIWVWTLVETPTLLGTVVYLLTHDFRTLIATFTGLLLFVNYRPSRLAEA
jgi:phage shock protein PspC (stress-responsive transcriptional regulator)